MTVRNRRRRPAAAQLGILLLGLGLPLAGPDSAVAVGGCTVISPATSCSYSCTAGETQHVDVTGTNVTGRADCGFGVAQCYTALGDVTCASSGSSAQFSDTYWNACSASGSGVWIVSCQSG